MRQVIQLFLQNKYCESLQVLENIWWIVEGDLFIGQHSNKIMEMIRQRAMVSFLYPYKSIPLKDVSSSFGTSVKIIEKELANLIADNLIQAKLDSHNKILYATEEDVRANMFAKAIKLGEDYVVETQNLLLRSFLLKNKMIVKLQRGGWKK